MDNQRGFTLVEMMAGVAVVGILAAVVAPSFKADAAKSKASEAKLELQRLAANARVYFQEHRRFPSGTAAVLPGADGDACKEAGKMFSVSTDWANDPVWSALDFQVEQKGRFSYHFEATSNKSARAWAVADPSCSGEQRVYMVILEGRASGRVESVMLDPDLPDPDELPRAEGDDEDIDSENAGTPEAPTHEEDLDPGMGLPSGDGTGGGAGGTGGGSSPLDGTDSNSSAGGSTGGSTSGGSTSGGSTAGSGPAPAGDTDASGGAVGGDSYSGNGNGAGGNPNTGGGTGNSGGGSTNSCGGSGTTIITCPSGYTLNLATCTCKKSK